MYKPCAKCGSLEKNNSGRCRPCALARSAIWYTKNHDKETARNAEYYLENRERLRIQHAEYQKKRPDLCRLKAHNYRARKTTNGGKLSPDIFDRLFKLQRGKCACCKTGLKNIKAHLDHMIPVSKQGPNVDSNMQLLCQVCNNQKYTKHPIDFMRSRGFLL